MKRNFRLTQASDFLRIKNDGKSNHHKLVVLAYIPNDLNFSRMACVTSKAVGNAVTRNLVKRRMKACVANSWSRVQPGWDLVFYARTASARASYNDWCAAIVDLIKRAGLYNL